MLEETTKIAADADDLLSPENPRAKQAASTKLKTIQSMGKSKAMAQNPRLLALMATLFFSEIVECVVPSVMALASLVIYYWPTGIRDYMLFMNNNLSTTTEAEFLQGMLYVLLDALIQTGLFVSFTKLIRRITGVNLFDLGHFLASKHPHFFLCVIPGACIYFFGFFLEHNGCDDKFEFLWLREGFNASAREASILSSKNETAVGQEDDFTILVPIMAVVCICSFIGGAAYHWNRTHRKRNLVVSALKKENSILLFKKEELEDAANPVKHLTARPPRNFTSDDFDHIIAAEGRDRATELLLCLCEEWVFKSPITDVKWDFFHSCVVSLAIWDERAQFGRLQVLAKRCRGPLNEALRKIVSELATDGADGEWLCKELQSIDAQKSVATVAGPWFSERYLGALKGCDRITCDTYDTEVLPDVLRFLAGRSFESFGKALDNALPSSAFHEGESKQERRSSFSALVSAAKGRLMIRYTRDKCVKRVKRMKVKVKEAHEADIETRPRICTIGDSLRASICASDAAGMQIAWEHLSSGAAPWQVVRLKNKVRCFHPSNTMRWRAEADFLL